MRYRVRWALRRHGADDERGQLAPTSTARGRVPARGARRSGLLGKDEDTRDPHLAHAAYPRARGSREAFRTFATVAAACAH
ncbi:hypothetical protein PsYK624_154100 [Phanerochaete sordida]|uniref:Uncharacterized protein n=1 Tax=Phanerochaete sordida TaxID=48140 RepID=A0A9P3LKZ9_9APHY|nr:hypothetical protein PsYK624_154100 [Phanerochaete sordida]